VIEFWCVFFFKIYLWFRDEVITLIACACMFRACGFVRMLDAHGDGVIGAWGADQQPTRATMMPTVEQAECLVAEGL
jgi:hypothetical protein